MKPQLPLLRSPCIALCKLDRQNVCEGCYRTIDEILSWSGLNDTEKQQVIERIATRRS